MNALAAITGQFAAQGYVVVRRLVPDARTAQLRAHLETRAAQGALRMEGDSQVPGTPAPMAMPCWTRCWRNCGRRSWPAPGSSCGPLILMRACTVMATR